MTPLEIAAGVTAGGAALALLWRSERRMRRLANRLLGDGSSPSALDRLDKVYAEVHPNSGSSLRDQVDATCAMVTEQRDLLVAHVATPRDRAHPR